MSSPWIITPDAAARARTAHDVVVGERGATTGVRRLVAESWERSLRLSLDPDSLLAGVDLGDEELRAYRDAHPKTIKTKTYQ